MTFAYVDGLPEVAADEPEELLGVVDGFVDNGCRQRPRLLPIEMRDHLAAQAQRIHLVVGEVVTES